MEIGEELSREAVHWVTEKRTGDCPKWVMSTSELEVRLFNARAARPTRQLATTGLVVEGLRAATKCGGKWVRGTGSMHGMRSAVRQAGLRRANYRPSDVVGLERRQACFKTRRRPVPSWWRPGSHRAGRAWSSCLG